MTTYTCTDYSLTKRSRGSQLNSLRALRHFILSVYPDTPREEIDAYSIRYVDEVRKKERGFFSDAVSFLHSEWGLSVSPTVLRQAVNWVVDWMRWNDYELSASETARLKQLLPRRAVLTEDEALTVPKIQTILIHSDVMMRAFLLLLASSGMRANELVKAKFSDMREDGGCLYIHIPASRMKARKTHDYRYSREAADALKEYLKVRKAIMQKASVLQTKCLNVDSKADEDRIFPFSYNAFSLKLHNALSRAGMLRKDENSGRYTISFQAFRRWFDSTLKTHIPVNMANEIIGHDEGLSTNYRRYPRDAVDAAYLEVEPYLRIFTADDIRNNSSQVNSALEEQKQTTAALAAEVLKQRETIEALRLYIEATRDIEKKKKRK